MSSILDADFRLTVHCIAIFLPISPTTGPLASSVTVSSSAEKFETSNYEIKTRKHPKKISFL